MGIFLPDMKKERKIKTVPIWIEGRRVLVDQYSFGYKNVLGEHEQLRCSFIRENAAQNGEGACRQRSGYVLFGDEVCRVEDNFSQVGVINKTQSGKWVVELNGN